MSIFKEYSIVLENGKLKEDLGIESFIFAKLTVDVTTVIAFRESVGNDGEMEPYTIINTDSGHTFCIEIPYEDFQIMFYTEVIPYLEKLEKENEN